jgi:large repetitive protein
MAPLRAYSRMRPSFLSLAALGLVLALCAGPISPARATATFFVRTDGSDSMCNGTVNAAGLATLSISTLGVGAHPIAAFYSGDDTFSASDTAASPLAQTVQKADTITTITSHTPNPSRPGQPVLVLFTVMASPPGAGAPTGAVTISDGSATCTSSVAAGSCSITLSAAGARNLTAAYTGDTNFNSSSGSATQRVMLSVFLPITLR